MESTKRLYCGFTALATLSNPTYRPAVYYSLNEAIQEAIKRQSFDAAAALRDLREALTDNYVPATTPADELRAAAGV